MPEKLKGSREQCFTIECDSKFGDSPLKTPGGTPKTCYDGNIFIKSTLVQGFSRVLCPKAKNIVLSDCFISESSEIAIESVNPQNIIIKNVKFRQNYGTCLQITLSPSSRPFSEKDSPQLGGSKIDTKPFIYLHNLEFLNSVGKCIEFRGEEDLSSLPMAKSQVRANFFVKNCNFGLNQDICVHLTNIYCSNLFMENCVFLKNRLACIYCEFVNKLTIMNTEIGNNHGPGVVSKNSVLNINNSSIYRNTTGLLIQNRHTPAAANLSSVILDFTKFCDNSKSGIDYQGFTCQSINITNVKMSGNNAGLSICETGDLGGSAQRKLSADSKNSPRDAPIKMHRFKVKDCQISENKTDGVRIMNLTSELSILKSAIKDNEQFAIYVENPNQNRNVIWESNPDQGSDIVGKFGNNKNQENIGSLGDPSSCQIF